MGTSKELKEKIQERRQEVQQAIGQRLSFVSQLKDCNEAARECRYKEDLFRQELAVVSQASNLQLKSAADSLMQFSNSTLPRLFGGEYELVEIAPDASTNGVNAGIKLYKRALDGTLEETDPFDDNGGGVCDIISLQTRLGALLGYEPSVEGPFIADEPSKHVSAKFREGLALVLREICHETGRQIIIATHDPALTVASDHVIEF